MWQPACYVINFKACNLLLLHILVGLHLLKLLCEYVCGISENDKKNDHCKFFQIQCVINVNHESCVFVTMLLHCFSLYCDTVICVVSASTCFSLLCINQGLSIVLISRVQVSIAKSSGSVFIPHMHPWYISETSFVLRNDSKLFLI